MDLFTDPAAKTRDAGLIDALTSASWRATEALGARAELHRFTRATATDCTLGWETDVVLPYRFGSAASIEAGYSAFRAAGDAAAMEAMRLMDTVRGLGKPLFVLTGGDPLKRADTILLVEYGTRIGLRVAMTPSGTPLMNATVLAALRDAGLARLAVSVDGSTAAIHDRFRGVSARSR